MHMHFYKKSWWAAGAVGTVLGRLRRFTSPPQALVRYDLGAAPALVAASAPLQPIALAQIQAPLPVEGSTGLRYRLAYADAQELRTYAQARWSLQTCANGATAFAGAFEPRRARGVVGAARRIASRWSRGGPCRC